MKDNIRQGGVLSVAEYATMVDNMCETIVNSNMGAKYGHITISALLLMDDITLISNTPTELQSMLGIIHMQAMKFHVRFGDDKCKVMLVNNKDPSNYVWRLGCTQLKCIHILYIHGRNNNIRLYHKKSPGDKGARISSSTQHSEGNN